MTVITPEEEAIILVKQFTFSEYIFDNFTNIMVSTCVEGLLLV